MSKDKLRDRLHAKRTSMLGRCYDPGDSRYKGYGARGITVCQEWRDSSTKFIEWAWASGYTGTESIDRVDNNGNYCPENCQWISREAQARNRRDTVLWEYQGEFKTIPEWAEIFSMTKSNLYQRLGRGWSFEDSISLPLGTRNSKKKAGRPEERYDFKYDNGKVVNLKKTSVFFTLNGETKHLTAWAQDLGVSPGTISYRLKRGWSLEEALTIPPSSVKLHVRRGRGEDV